MDADPSIGTEILIILLLILANGICVMTEITIVSSRKARLERQAAEGSAGAKKALELANDPTELLEQFQQTGTHIAFVMDEFGGLIGVVTLHDILEQWVGELPEEEENPEVVKRDDNSRLMD